MQTPLVSVIVRTKDRPADLQRCLTSIAKQSYRPLNVTVINDGGACIEPTITHFHPHIDINLIQLPENKGRTQAANLGLDAASGDYITFLDDDDYWLPQHLSQLTNKLPPHPCAIYSATKAVQIDKLQGEEKEREIKVYNTPFQREHLLYNNFLPILSVLFHRNPIDKGIRFDENFDLFEDWDFWLQISQELPFTHTNDITCVYRLHEQASGVHHDHETNEAYHAIYQKWLHNKPTNELLQLIHQTHHWQNQTVAELQHENRKQIDAIGAQHSHALDVIASKDSNIHTLEDAHRHALDTITDKDRDIDHLSKLHRHALRVIAEKDTASQELAAEYQHAIKVIQEKEATAQQLSRELQHTQNTNQEQQQTLHKLNQRTEEQQLTIQEQQLTIKALQARHPLLKTLYRLIQRR